MAIKMAVIRIMIKVKRVMIIDIYNLLYIYSIYYIISIVLLSYYIYSINDK